MELEGKVQLLISEISVLMHCGMEAEVNLLEACLRDAEAELSVFEANRLALSIGRLHTSGKEN